VAVASDDASRLTRVPGIGKKTAERLVLELRDKLPSSLPAAKAASVHSGDVLNALLSLGYNDREASAAIRGLPPDLPLADAIRQALKVRPEAEGFRFLALAEAQSGNPAAAAKALRRAVALAPGRADLWEMLGLSLISGAGGEVTPDARDALATALRLAPGSLVSRFHLARARAASGDREGGIRDLRAIASDLPAGDPRRADIETAIREAQAPAGPAVDGPASEMIGRMVSGLAERLQANPDDPEGWIRLVRSYAVLGDTAKRDAALDQARRRYSGTPDILGRLEAAARTEPMK
jgi:cytochrome c-type biogenesis protein CcmH